MRGPNEGREPNPNDAAYAANDEIRDARRLRKEAPVDKPEPMSAEEVAPLPEAEYAIVPELLRACHTFAAPSAQRLPEDKAADPRDERCGDCGLNLRLHLSSGETPEMRYGRVTAALLTVRAQRDARDEEVAQARGTLAETEIALSLERGRSRAAERDAGRLRPVVETLVARARAYREGLSDSEGLDLFLELAEGPEARAALSREGRGEEGE